MSTVVSFAGDWAVGRAAFVIHNNSQRDIFIRLNAPRSIGWDIPGLMAIVISDAILVGFIMFVYTIS